MFSLNRLFVVGLALVILVSVVRGLIPYEIETSQELTPSVYEVTYTTVSDEFLRRILKNNIWFEEREALAFLDDETQVDEVVEEVVEEVAAEPSRASIKLVGVSTGEGPAFAVIQTGDLVERYRPGDMLPDESKLLEITSYSIETTYAGNNEKLYLFGKY